VAGLPPGAAADGGADPDGGVPARVHRAIIEYPVASILLKQQDMLTMAVGSKMFLYEQKYLWGDFAAAAILSGCRSPWCSSWRRSG
jgi:hypothetical protein